MSNKLVYSLSSAEVDRDYLDGHKHVKDWEKVVEIIQHLIRLANRDKKNSLQLKGQLARLAMHAEQKGLNISTGNPDVIAQGFNEWCDSKGLIIVVSTDFIQKLPNGSFKGGRYTDQGYVFTIQDVKKETTSTSLWKNVRYNPNGTCNVRVNGESYGTEGFQRCLNALCKKTVW